MSKFLRKFWNDLGYWFRRQPLPIKLVMALFALAIAKLIEESNQAVAQLLQLDELASAALILAAVAIAAVAALSAAAMFGSGGGTIGDELDLDVRRVFSTEELRRIRTGLHYELYGEVAPNGDEIDKMYEKNPRMGVGLYDPKVKDYVAFATAWPLTDEAGRKLIDGQITENDLTANDILPERDNRKANYVLMPAFGATRKDGFKQRGWYGRELRGEMRKAMKQNFFGRSSRRKLTFIATGFSEDGETMCRRRGMQQVRLVYFKGDPKPKPLCTKQIGIDDLD